jgi:hypothetical protein
MNVFDDLGCPWDARPFAPEHAWVAPKSNVGAASAILAFPFA